MIVFLIWPKFQYLSGLCIIICYKQEKRVLYGVAVIKVTRWDGYGGIDLVGKEMDAP